MSSNADIASLIAGIVIDTPLLHLDRVFDYRVPEKLRSDVAVGSHVRVRFAGRLVSGWVVDLRDHTDHSGRLANIERVLGEGATLTPETIAACRATATRWIGTFADVVRAAVPPRVAAVDRAEAERSMSASMARTTRVPASAPEWAAAEIGIYPGLAEILAAQEPAHAAVLALPGRHPMRILAATIAVRVAQGGVLVVLPDVADVRTLSQLLTTHHIEHTQLTSQTGRDARWRAFRRILNGEALVVIGTRGAAFAPISRARTFIIWDDGATTYEEPHAPYWHAREVLALRAQAESAAFVTAGVALTTEVAALAKRGWLRVFTAAPSRVRECAPRVVAAPVRGEGADRLAAVTGIPDVVSSSLRSGLQHGPALILVPRRGYVPAVICGGCRTTRTCHVCSAGLHITVEGLACTACATQPAPQCTHCGSRAFRARSIGQDRLVEQFGKAFPGVRIITSNADRSVTHVEASPAIVIATSGCEPIAAAGYTAVVALDVATWLALTDLRAEQFAYTRLAHAFSLARAQAPAVIVGDSTTAVAQALIRWDPVGFADRQLRERESAHLPPAARLVSLLGAASDLLEVLEELTLPQPSRVMGPMPLPSNDPTEAGMVAHITVPWRHGARVSAELRNVLAQRQAAHRGQPIRVHIDSTNFG